MKFGTGSNAERTQKYGGSKYSKCLSKCVSVSLATLARRLLNIIHFRIMTFISNKRIITINLIFTTKNFRVTRTKIILALYSQTDI